MCDRAGIPCASPRLSPLAPASRAWAALAPQEGTGGGQKLFLLGVSRLCVCEQGLPWAQYGLQANLLWQRSGFELQAAVEGQILFPGWYRGTMCGVA